MEKLTCKYFDNCSAPLCPLDPNSLKHGIWYPGEEICKRRDFATYDWLRTQKKLARKAKKDGYFTFEMLKRNCVIAKGITGLDPDKEEKPQLITWFKKHPPKKKLTRAQTKLILDRLKKEARIEHKAI